MASRTKTKKQHKHLAQRRASRSLQQLIVSAAALPCLGISATAGAQSSDVQNEVRLEYFFYQDWQAGYDKRMRVNSPMASVKSNIGEKDTIEGSFVYDAMSGASPLYHDTLSGASGKGIEDGREAGDLVEWALFGGCRLFLRNVRADVGKLRR